MAPDHHRATEDGFAPPIRNVRRLTPTPDRLWRDHAERLRLLAQEMLGADRDAVEVACYRTLLRAARAVSQWTRPTPPDGSWRWFAAIAKEVCEEILEDGFAREEVPDGPILDALPSGLRVSLQLRAIRDQSIHELEEYGATTPAGEAILAQRQAWREESERRRLRGIPSALLPGLVLDALERWTGSVRSLARRMQAHVTTGPPSAPKVAAFLSGSPTLPEAALAVTAAVALGMGAGPASPATAVESRVASARSIAPAPEAPAPAPEDDHDTTAIHRAPPAPPTAKTMSTMPPTRSEPASPDTRVEPPEPAPELSAEPPDSGEAVASESYESDYNYREPGRSYETPSTRVQVDGDGDGEHEANVATPYVFVNCTRPEDRGPVTDATCETLEASGAGE